MPLYTYQCDNCESVDDYPHEYGKVPTKCVKCNKMYSLNRVYNAIAVQTQQNSEVGNLVKKSIKDFKEDLKEQKKELSSEY